jgi:hypothetical protein
LLVLNAAPLPRRSSLRRFGLFRFRSPLLAESLLFSFPPGTEMFHFPGFARACLCIQHAVRQHYLPWVSPFGYHRINAWLAAPRCFSQLPTSFVASCRLGIHRVPFVAWSSCPLVLELNSTRPRSSPVGACLTGPSHFLLLSLLAHMLLSMNDTPKCGADRDRTDDIQLAKLALSQLSYSPLSVVGLDRFELSTPRLSSVCSNQLSYRPSFFKN